MKKCKTCLSTETSYQWYKGPRCAKCYQNERYLTPRIKFGINHKLNRAKQAAKKRDVLFNVPIELYKEVLEKGCFYCSKDLFKETGSSLDRVNPNDGYHKNNIVGCCGNCNMMKHSILSVDETKEIIVLLRKLRNKNGSPW